MSENDPIDYVTSSKYAITRAKLHNSKFGEVSLENRSREMPGAQVGVKIELLACHDDAQGMQRSLVRLGR